MVDIIMLVYSKMPAPNYLENIERLFKYTKDFKLILIKSDKSVAENRNYGMLSANSDTIVFLDDDCSVGQGWLEGLLAPLNDPIVGMVGHSVTKDDGKNLEYLDNRYVECHCAAIRNVPFEWNEENVGGGANDFDVCEQISGMGYKIVGYKNLPIEHTSLKRNQHFKNWENYKRRWGGIK